MSDTWDKATTKATEWVQNWWELLAYREVKPDSELLKKMQDEFMKLMPKQQATAFMFLFGKIVRDERDNSNQ